MNAKKIMPLVALSMLVSGGMVSAAPIDVVIFKDTFDVKHVNGDQLNGREPEVGVRWQDITGVPQQNAVTNAQANPSPGLSWLQQRNDDGGAGGVLTRVDSSNPNNLSTADRLYTMKFDMFTTDLSSGPSIIMQPGGTAAAVEFGLLSGTWRYYNPNTASYVDSDVYHATNEWVSIEIEYEFGPATGTGHFVDYAFYVTQGSTPGTNGPQPIYTRQLILSGTSPNKVPEASEMIFNISPAGNPVSVYFDNVQYGYQVVPEPTAIGFIGLAGAALLRRRRA